MADPGDWLNIAWCGLSSRSREILTRRLAGETLESIAQSLGRVTRERVRQIQKQASAALVERQREEAPELPALLHTELGEHPALAEDQLLALLPTRAAAARSVLLGQLGLSRPQTWIGSMDQYWTWVPEALDRSLRQLTALAPLTFDEAERAASEVRLPDVPDWRELLAAPQSPVTRCGLGWIRPSRSSRDLAYLWLKTEGEPRSADEIAAVAECSAHAIRETMRRDGAFAQVRPEGTWALSDWRVPGSGNQYANAVDVVVEVLRDLGPLDYEQLRVETQRRYPVSAWRINQCLSSNQVGLDNQGLYDLVERGASPIEDTEPKRPKNMAVQGSVVGVQLTVDHDLLRGSGISVNRWLSWHLGLRTAPTIRYFDLPDGFGSLTCKRATSNAQLSSLRVVAQALGVQDGCKLTVILRTDVNTATVRHNCSPDVCPAMASDRLD